MTGQLSRQMLLKMGDGGDPEGFDTIAALTAKSMSLGGTGIDVTADNSVSVASATKLVREQIAGGVQTLDLSGDLRLKEASYEADLVNLKMSGNPIANWQVSVPSLGTFEGSFHLDTLDFSGGDSAGDVTGSISLTSAGDFTFTAAT